MKKLLLIAAGIALIAASCNKSAPGDNTNQNPPENTEQNSTYSYAPYGFEFNYGADWQFTSPAYANLEEKIVQVQLPQSTYPGTNFGDAAFTVSAGTAATLDECLQLNSADTAGFNTVQEINGTTYTKAETSEAAAGNLYESRIFRTLRGNTCIEVLQTIHTGNIGNYEPGTVTQVNKDTVWEELNKVLATFKFN